MPSYRTDGGQENLPWWSAFYLMAQHPAKQLVKILQNDPETAHGNLMGAEVWVEAPHVSVTLHIATWQSQLNE